METDKSKIELEVNDDFLDYDTNEPLYCIRYTKYFPYKDQNNYLCHQEETDDLKSSSIDGLYEQMGELVVNHIIYGEKESKRDCWNRPRDEFKVEFSNIYIEVEYYNEERMKNSQVYKNIGLAKEKARIQGLELKAKEEKRAQEWRTAEKERIDREEFARLSKKFNKV